MLKLAIRGGKLRKQSVFAVFILKRHIVKVVCHNVKSICHGVKVFCHDVKVFCHSVKVFCHDVKVFCHSVEVVRQSAIFQIRIANILKPNATFVKLNVTFPFYD
jgi:hypothetical protein